MPHLDKTLRRQLAATIDKARLVAEEGAADAIRRLAVADTDAPAWLSDPDRLLRRTLRAHARSLGDTLDGMPGSTRHLIETAAFEHWHRMLFGRFLVERGLLIHPTLGAAIARDELAELAAEEGLPDAWALVERIAAPALPAVFKPHDPALLLSLAPEFAKRLRDLAAALPEAVFEADDSLGWTYQFWRAAEKERVNKAGGKIGAAELPVVTQLFTEPYMVRFLLHNTLGAWHAGRVLAADPALAADAPDEATLRSACALPGYDWEFLRFIRTDEPSEPGGERTGPWRPAAGTYPGWPSTAAEITMLDPCCGSGHFLTEALSALAAMRGAEERLSSADAVLAVLRDNLHGLEIDGRCVQIAAFALALTAWRIGGPSLTEPGTLPTPHVAWVGAPPPLPRTAFMDLANGDTELRASLAALHDLFAQAPLLGSLIAVTGGDLLDPARVGRIEMQMATLVERIRGTEPEQQEGAVAARGMADAAALLARRYVLQTTNVPYLGRGDQSDCLRSAVKIRYPNATGDLAIATLSRMMSLSIVGGTVAHVTIQNWLFLGTFKRFRKEFLEGSSLNVLATLGEEAWEAFGQRGPLATLLVATKGSVVDGVHSALDTTTLALITDKIFALGNMTFSVIKQRDQIRNPDSRVTTHNIDTSSSLTTHAFAGKGSTTGDTNNYNRYFWESLRLSGLLWLDSPTPGRPWSGRNTVIRVSLDNRLLREELGCMIGGQNAWGKIGVAVRKLRDLAPFMYDGEVFDDNICPIVPFQTADLAAIWCFVSSEAYRAEVRKVDAKRNVTSATLVKVPFDLAHWQVVAAHQYPIGLPEPYSDDPTQWLFHGHPAHAEPGTQLHVALARLAGYRWPAETDTEMRLSQDARDIIAESATLPVPDADGLLPLQAHGADPALADRLRTHLAAAFGAPLSPEAEAGLVRAADSKLDGKEARDVTVEAWLRDRAFRQHSKLFLNRPFLWHVWDGLPRDGFSAILHYHRLDHALLEKLTYTVLGDWISRAAAANQVAQLEAAQRLQQKLVAILHGEAPHDIFVRWKSLARQPLGWTPDLDDGVRLNIRPFMTAGILREQPRGIAWGKDRGTDVPSAPWFHLGPAYGEKEGARINDHHPTLAEKHAARAATTEAEPAAAAD